jgi:hypothetical protein
MPINKQLQFILYETLGLTAILAIVALLLVLTQKSSTHMLISFGLAWVIGFIGLIYQSKKI